MCAPGADEDEGDDGGIGEGERERERRPAARTESARSSVLGLGEVGVPPRTGECVRLLPLALEEEESPRRGDGGMTTGGGGGGGADLGDEDPLAAPNQSARREALTGMVISEWITCVSGAATGAGDVGGSAWKTRSKGGRILGND